MLVDGDSVAACLMFAVQADGRAVSTVEGMADAGPAPAAGGVLGEAGLQCGFCTPGMLVPGKENLDDQPDGGE